MSNTVNTNVMSLNTQRQLAKSSEGLQVAMQRLSSGLRVNSAKDDSAGLAISERFHAQVRGIAQATRNAQDGISFSQTAEGALQEVGEMLQRMRELAVQSANGINSSSDRVNLNNEYAALGSEIKRTLESTDFNGKKLLAASAGSFTFQVGANNASTMQIKVSTVDMVKSLASAYSVAKITSQGAAQSALGVMDKAIDKVTTMRAKLGAIQNRFAHTINNLRNASENQAAARGRIIDADFASETASLSRYQVLQQVGTAMLSQANQAPNQVLSLIR